MFEFMITETEKLTALLVFHETLNCCLAEYLKVFRKLTLYLTILSQALFALHEGRLV